VEIGPGMAYVIEPGHDAWVVGDERFVGFEFESRAAEEYAKGWPERAAGLTLATNGSGSDGDHTHPCRGVRRASAVDAHCCFARGAGARVLRAAAWR
jgi:hypothetical protein